MSDVRYLEIGTWKGSSVSSFMCNNRCQVVCIDNWSEFGGPKEEFLVNFNKYKGVNNATFIEKNCFDVDVGSLIKFNVYMYDGNNTKESHYRALTHFYDCLDDIFIYIVDDWNWVDVRDGTFSDISRLDLKILFQHEIRLTQDNSHTRHDIAQKSWWNGIFIAILSKK